MEKLSNPASAVSKTAAERRRIPMSVPVQKLEVPDLPGYHLHWFNGTAARIQRALDGGYEFVENRDIKINSVGLGGDSTLSGSTDMGGNVSVVAGSDIGHDGQPVRLVLMKIKQEWYEEDQKLIEDSNDRMATALRGGMIGAEKDAVGDAQQRYVDQTRTKIPDLFTKKRPR
jgi:hypothetical protein